MANYTPSPSFDFSKYGMSVKDLIDTTVNLENSGHNAVSPAGAQGRLQIMPKTAKALGVDPWDYADSRRGAEMLYNEAAHAAIRQKPDITGGQLRDYMFAYYNGGPTQAAKVLAGNYRGLPDETRKYVERGQNLYAPDDNGSFTPRGKVLDENGNYLGSTVKTQQTKPQQPQQQIDLSPYMDKYGARIAASRERGFDDAAILRSIVQVEDTARSQEAVRATMAASRKDVLPIATKIGLRNGSHTEVASYLATKPGFDRMVEFYRANGWDDSKIVQKLMPEAVKGIDAYNRRAGKSFTTNVVDGAVDGAESIALAGRQMFATSPDTQAQLSAQEQARRDDVDRQALLNTGGGAVGGEVPGLAAEMAVTAAASAAVPATGGLAAPAAAIAGAKLVARGARIASLVNRGKYIIEGAAMGGVAGGTHGLITPTVVGESRTDNVINGAVSGAVGGAAFSAGVPIVAGAANTAANAVRKVLRNDQPTLANDINSRIIGERIAHEVGVPLEGQYLSKEWATKANSALSNEYNAILDGNYARIPDNIRAALSDPNLQSQMPANVREQINQLLHKTETKVASKAFQRVDENGQPMYTYHQRGVNGLDGKPMTEKYIDTIFDEVPQYETRYRPKTQFEPQDPKMLNKQVIGEDGNVQTVVRQRPAYDDKTGNRLIDVQHDGDSFIASPAMERYNKPVTEQVQVPGKMASTQVRDAQGNVVMEPYRVQVRDAQGNPVIDRVPRQVEKYRPITTVERKPMLEYRDVPETVTIPRTDPIPLRDVHSLQRLIKDMQYRNTTGGYTDGQLYDVLNKLRGHVDDVFYNHNVMSPEWAASRGINPDTIPTYLTDSLKNINGRYGQLSVAEKALVKADYDGSKLYDNGIWDSIMGSRQYADRAMAGTAPLQEIAQAAQTNAKTIAAHNDAIKHTDQLTNNALVNMSMLVNPMGAVSMAAGALKGAGALRKAQLNRNVNRHAGTEDLILPSMQINLDSMRQLASQGAASNVDRRVADTGGVNRYNDDRTQQIRRRLAGPIGGISAIDTNKDK